MTYLLCNVCGSNKVENSELGLCATHNKERRDKENEKVKVIKPIKKVSEKRADELLKYPKLKKNFLEHKMVCELRFEGCLITAAQIHHCSKSALNFLNTNTWMSCCQICHSQVEDMSAEERRKKGYLTD